MYDYLNWQVVDSGIRSVDVLKTGNLLSKCQFFSDIVPDEAALRKEYLDRFFRVAEGADLVFFDPDNGIEVQSVRYGNRDSRKYVYRFELQRAFSLGHSLLIYQHFPRRPRALFVREQSKHLQDLLEPDALFAFHDSDVAFFLASQPKHREFFDQAFLEIAAAWEEGRELCLHGPLRDTGTCIYG